PERHEPPSPEPAAPEPRAAEVAAESAEPLFGELLALLAEARGLLRGSGFPWGRLQALVDRCVTALARSADLFWLANNPAAPAGADYVALHQARVCIMALRIGGGVGDDRARLHALGTVVRLNAEEVGRVIAVNRNHPLRPKVEVLADGKGQRLPAPNLIDLSEAPFLYITGSVGEGGR